jgi:hypothetical protein
MTGDGEMSSVKEVRKAGEKKKPARRHDTAGSDASSPTRTQCKLGVKTDIAMGKNRTSRAVSPGELKSTL